MCRGDIGNIEFIDGINYCVYEDCPEKGVLDTLEEIDYLIPQTCFYCYCDLGMNKDCVKCIDYRETGVRYI